MVPGRGAERIVADQLIGSARAATGLLDFGGESFRGGLEVLTLALEREAELTAAGQDAVRARLSRLLENRLRIEDWIRRHPEIEEQEIEAPIFMIGPPRTGTTALGALLARDPDTRVLRNWESSRPTPPPEEATQHEDPRIAATQAGIDAMNTAYPEWRTMYDASATDSAECQDLLGMEFRTQHFCGSYRIPSYDAWQRRCDMEPAYRYQRRVLKLLQWHCPPTRWLLHAPVHMLSLDALDRVFPDARFLMTHRDPARVLGSVCSLMSFSRGMASDQRDPKALGIEQVDLWVEALVRAIRFRDRVGETRFADIRFADLISDPIAAVGGTYAGLGIPFTETARANMTAWAAERPRGRHGEHRYRLEDFGLEADRVRARFDFYVQRFGVSLESDREGRP